MKKMHYWARAIQYGFKSKIIYRMSAWIGSFSNLTTFLIQVMVWKSLLGSGSRFDTSFEQMLTYLVLTQLAVSVVRSFSGDAISRLINTGDISIYLIRPIDLKLHLFLNDLGKNLFEVIVVNLPVCILLILGWGFTMPENPLVIPLTIVMLLNGMVMLFLYRYILGLLSFWLVNNPFTTWHFQNAESIFSGQVLPIWLCPIWLVSITRFLPFRYFTYEPLALFVGKSTISQAGWIILIQLIWISAFYILEKIVSARAVKKLVVQGG